MRYSHTNATSQLSKIVAFPLPNPLREPDCLSILILLAERGQITVN
jgi:hypothetical protein